MISNCIKCNTEYQATEKQIKKWNVCPPCRREYQNDYRRRTGYDTREDVKAKRISHIRALRVKALAMFGSKCAVCGISDLRVLHIDHIDGGGQVERKTYGSLTFYSRIVKGLRTLEDLQVLCANCHMIKTYHA